jgi:hypothetical protein
MGQKLGAVLFTLRQIDVFYGGVTQFCTGVDQFFDHDAHLPTVWGSRCPKLHRNSLAE